MPVLSFGEYRPDVSDYKGQYSRTIQNVVPQGDGYAPFKDLVAATAALPAACRGMLFARRADGTVSLFAGTSNRLYILDNTALTWTDISKGATNYSALSNNAQWQFRQFNSFVFAVQANAPTQVYDITSSSAFADLGGSPPQAAYISIVNRFVVLSGLASPNTTRIQWSGLNATTTWTSGVNQSDFQDEPDGGAVRGVAGGELGIIFQDAAIRRMTFAPGSPIVFGIDRISSDDGLLGPYSIIEAGDRIFFCSPQGFKVLDPSGYPQPIGKERIDRTFLADYDSDHPELFIGAHDPRSQRVFWAYKSINSARAAFDTILCYDWVLDRWTKSSITGQYLVSLARPGMTLENVDTAYGTNIDTIDLSSLDDISSAARATLAAADGNGAAGFFTGDNLEATLVTAEQGDDVKRVRIRGFRPITDATAALGSVTTRDTAQDASVISDESSINEIGLCEQNVTARYSRGRLRIPAGSEWTFAAGVEPDIVPVGNR